MWGIFILLFLINSFIPQDAYSENITISANNVIWNRKEEVTTLTGNVLIIKGSISISSSRMKVIGKLSALNEVIGEAEVKVIDEEKNIHITGGYMKYCKPTEYLFITNSPKLELKKENIIVTSMKMEGFYKKGEFIATDSVKIIHNDILATASKAVYSDGGKKLELTGNPQLTDGGNKLTGEKIVYYFKEDRFEVINNVKGILIR